jgi:outer membrane biosynthesis protein TonB
MSKSPLFRATAATARKHSRVSLIAATAATVGALGAVGFAAGAAPWTQALDNVANTVGNGSQLTASGHTDLFKSITGATAGKPAAGTQLDTIRSAATGGSTAAPVAEHQPVQQAAVADKQQPAQQHAVAAKQQPAKQAAKPAPAKQAAKPAVAKPAAKPAPAKPKAAVKPKAVAKPKPAAPAKPYTLYDSVTPSSIPAGKAAAVYANGNYAASASQATGHGKVLWIDVNGSNPSANVLDVEPGDATPAGAAVWAQQRLSSHPKETAIIYTMLSQWQAVKDNVAHLPGWMQSKVRYWIADPTGVPHVVAGSSATQWYWGAHYDITTANPEFTH